MFAGVGSRCPRAAQLILALLLSVAVGLLVASLGVGEPGRVAAAATLAAPRPSGSCEPRAMAAHEVAHPPLPRTPPTKSP